jgi:acyl-CoA thioester hydrolase
LTNRALKGQVATVLVAIEPFRYLLRVRYAECDAQKVVFNARYGDYIDLAVTEFLRALGYGSALIDGSLDYQLVKQTLEWAAPARFDQVIAVAVRSTRLGTTSFVLATEFRVHGEPGILAHGETIYVLVDAESLKKRAIPDDLRAALERGAQGAVIDHAGALPTH